MSKPQPLAAAVIEVRQELARASAMLDVKRFDEAAELLARIVATEPESSRAWCLMARAHLGAGRYPEAVETASGIPARVCSGGYR